MPWTEEGIEETGTGKFAVAAPSIQAALAWGSTRAGRGAPSTQINSGQIKCQSFGRRSQRRTSHSVARSMATHRAGNVLELSAAICERCEGEMPICAAKEAARPRSTPIQSLRFMPSTLGQPKKNCKDFLNAHVYSLLNMDEIRRNRLAYLLRTRYNGSRGELAAAAALSAGRITQLLDSQGVFGERAARALEEKLSLPDRWLDQEIDANTEPAPVVQEGVPLISWIRAGEWDDASDPFQPGEAEAWVPSMRSHSKRAYALRVRGDSMTAPYGKSYPEGCIIIVEPERRSPVNGERIIAKLEGSTEVTFKVYKEEDGRRWLQPLNPSHEPIREHFRVLGTVIGKWEEE